jgi:hypothetical protein
MRSQNITKSGIYICIFIHGVVGSLCFDIELFFFFLDAPSPSPNRAAASPPASRVNRNDGGANKKTEGGYGTRAGSYREEGKKKELEEQQGKY